MKRYTLISFAIVLLSGWMLACSHSTEPQPGIVRDLTPLEKTVVQSSADFGLKLFREIHREEQQKNTFISPLSIAMALGMTLNGAAGDTRAAIEQVLELNGFSADEINQTFHSLIDLLVQLDPRVRFEIANSIWYRNGVPIDAKFLETNRTYFDALVQALNFGDREATAATINAWVQQHTNGKIEKIINPDDIDSLTIMFLVNAIYFKGMWSNRFDRDKTVTSEFTNLRGTRRHVPMMRRTGTLRYINGSGFQGIDLPYGAGLYSMVALLPDDGAGLDSLIAAMTSANWARWLAGARETEVDLAFPKFKLEYEITLNEALKRLGMAIAFDPESADFSKISPLENLYISKVKHKTFVQVDEEGTEAAAVTSVEVLETSLPRIVELHFNRPFVFAIRDNHSGTILFIGKIVDLEAAANSE